LRRFPPGFTIPSTFEFQKAKESIFGSFSTSSENGSPPEKPFHFSLILPPEPKQPTTNNQQPTTNNQQPTTNNQQPTTNNQQPTTNNQQQPTTTTTNNQQPTTNNQQPTTNNQQQPTTTQQQSPCVYGLII
jgi:hypothetical protein